MKSVFHTRVMRKAEFLSVKPQYPEWYELISYCRKMLIHERFTILKLKRAGAKQWEGFLLRHQDFSIVLEMGDPMAEDSLGSTFFKDKEEISFDTHIWLGRMAPKWDMKTSEMGIRGNKPRNVRPDGGVIRGITCSTEKPAKDDK